MRSLRAAAALVLLAASPLAAATFEVVVKRADGSPAAGAVVCLGTTLDLNQFDQKTADGAGRVSFGTVPPTPFRITAALDGRGRQEDRTSLASLSFGLATLTLPAAAGGPSCPSTPSGAERTLVNRTAISESFTSVTTPTTAITQLQRTEFCFGALGNRCGQPQGPIPPTALCTAGRCFINGGSWDHDECCFAHPQGKACRLPELAHDGNCVTAWDKALRLTGKGLMWQRSINFAEGNTTGRVDFAKYCAPANALLNPADANRCCAGSARALTSAEAAASVATGESLVACR
jgi:hypothetical protein